MSDYKFTIAVAEDNDHTQNWQFSNAVDAVNTYNSFIDHGMAKFVRTIVLTEPSGKQHWKILRSPTPNVVRIRREPTILVVK